MRPEDHVINQFVKYEQVTHRKQWTESTKTFLVVLPDSARECHVRLSALQVVNESE